ncbi:MAG: hypothetical protein ABUT39_21405 [Acidobacteriota bacterium]
MGLRAPRLVVALAAGAVLFATGQAGAAELVSGVERFSASASAESRSPSLSADGRWVAFQSTARNLVAGQVSGGVYGNVFLRDRVTGANVLASHIPGSPQTAGNLHSYSPIVSADGSVVAFLSSSGDLVAGLVDQNAGDDIYLYERATGSVVLVSHAAGAPTSAGSGDCYTGTLVSADGRYIAFNCRATNLVAGQTDTNGEPEAFLYDRVAGTTVLVSHKPGLPATAGNAGAAPKAMSADGRFLVIASLATDLVPGQSGLFLYDRTTGALTAVAPGAAPGFAPASISADGNYIAILSMANLVPGQVDPGGQQDIFLYDRQAGTFALVTHAHSSAVTSADGWAFPPRLSADGRWVVYQSDAGNLVAGQTGNSVHQLYLYDRLSGTNTLITHNSGSPTASSNEFADNQLALSSDGRYVAFASHASDLVAGQVDANQSYDVFLYDRTTNASTLLSHIPASAVTAGSDRSWAPAALSGDGRWIAFFSDAADLAADDFNATRDVFLYDSQDGTLRLASERDPANPARTGVLESRMGDVSDDGRYVVFHSPSPNMAEGVADTNGASDVFLRDRATGGTVLVSGSAAAPGTAANGGSGVFAVSGDGRWVAFGSEATDLVAGQTDLFQTFDLFLWDRETGARSLVNHTPSSPVATANWGAEAVALSADGRYVAFVSLATNLVAGQIDAPWDADVFVYDRTTGGTTLVSHKAGSALAAAGDCQYSVSISADGRYIAFTSDAPDLIPGLTFENTYTNVYLHDRITGITTLASRAPGPLLQAGNSTSYGSSLSQDGRFVAFFSTASDLVPGQSTHGSDIFLYDHSTGTVRLVSHVPGSLSTGGNSYSTSGLVSPDGSSVVFLSSARDLVAGQIEPGIPSVHDDLFRYDVRTGAVSLVSHAPDSAVTATNWATGLYSVGAGGAVVYGSRAGNLVPGQVDVPDTDDVFRYDPGTGANRLLTGVLSSPTQTSPGLVYRLRMSRDGRVAAFEHTAADLTPGDYNRTYDVFADQAPDTATDFHTVEPCRLLDTRSPGSGPALASGTVRPVAAHGLCGIPSTARALAVNVTVVGATGSGNLRLYPSGLIAPETSTINFPTGLTRANNAMVPLTPGVEAGLAALAMIGGSGGGTVHVLIDVTGWFE